MWRKTMIAVAAVSFMGAMVVANTADARIGGFGGFHGGGFHGGFGGFRGAGFGGFRGAGFSGFRGVGFARPGFAARGAFFRPGFVGRPFVGRPFVRGAFFRHRRFFGPAFVGAAFVVAGIGCLLAVGLAPVDGVSGGDAAGLAVNLSLNLGVVVFLLRPDSRAAFLAVDNSVEAERPRP